MNLEHVLAGLANSAVWDLERQGVVAAGELRDRLHQLAMDQAAVATRSMAGSTVDDAQAAVAARLKALQAAGLVLAASQLQRAVASAITTSMRLAFEHLGPQAPG